MDGIPSYPNHQCWCVVWGRKIAGSKVGGTSALSLHPLSAELPFARQVMSGFNIFGQIPSLFSRFPSALIATSTTGCGHGQERWWVPKQPSHCLVGLGQLFPPPVLGALVSFSFLWVNVPDHKINIVQYSCGKPRASVLYPTLTPLNKPFLHRGTLTLKDWLNVRVGHQALDVVSWPLALTTP